MAITRLGPNQDITAAKIAGQINFKNIIINGDMSIAQWGTSATGLTNGSSGYKTVDRFRFEEGGSPTAQFTMSQDTDVPTGQGFAKSLKMDVTTAQTSLAAADIIRIGTFFEGQNLQYIKKGTANAESLTLSFWVKSTKTGTYTMRLEDQDNSRMICKAYTINSASTWEKKTITFAGDTTGVLDNNNNLSFIVRFNLFAGSNYDTGTLQTTWGTRTDANSAVGQVNLADSTDNNWWITGIQLEVGTSASDFEFLPNTVNINRCQRYVYKLVSGMSQSFASGTYYRASLITCHVSFPTAMRASPTVTHATGTDYYVAYSNDTADGFDGFHAAPRGSINGIALDSNLLGASGTAGHGCTLSSNNSSAYIIIEAEL